jgi:hypothetical protein
LAVTYARLVDCGSTLGLYFGMTILTLFELIIFTFYQTSADSLTKKAPVPPKALLYGENRKKKAPQSMNPRKRNIPIVPVPF